MKIKNKVSLENFANMFGFDSNELLEISQNIENHYHTWYKKKSDGRERRIDAPKENLKKIQHTLLEKLNFYAPPQAHGGVKGKSIRTNALVHRQSKYSMIIDIKDAYPTVTRKTIYWFFREMNASAQLARILARLTTFRNQLPQGAPTSLAIFNSLLGADNLFNLDLRFSLAKIRGRKIYYSRYVDDLTFSSKARIPKEFPKLVAEKLNEVGLKINPKKTRFGSIKRGALKVTGINLIDGKTKIPPKEIKRFRGMIGRATIDNSISANKVFGVIAYAMGIEKKIPNQLLKPLVKYLEKNIVPCPKKISQQIKKQTT
jgi:hypothetical protein